MTISNGIPQDQPSEARVGSPTQDDETVRIGQEAWSRLKREAKTLHDWLAVGRAHVIGRTEAMRAAHTNKPEGRAYCAEFSNWIERHGFGDLDKGDRSRLFKLMDNWTAIEAYLTVLTQTERLRLNHPTNIVRKWETAQRKPDTEALRTSPYKKLEQANLTLQDENFQLHQKLKHAGDGDSWSARDNTPDDIADALIGQFEPYKGKSKRVVAAAAARLGLEIKPKGKGKAAAAATSQDNISTMLQSLFTRMDTGGLTERDLPAILESKPSFVPLDLIELAKRLTDIAHKWQAHNRNAAKVGEAAAAPAAQEPTAAAGGGGTVTS